MTSRIRYKRKRPSEAAAKAASKKKGRKAAAGKTSGKRHDKADPEGPGSSYRGVELPAGSGKRFAAMKKVVKKSAASKKKAVASGSRVGRRVRARDSHRSEKSPWALHEAAMTAAEQAFVARAAGDNAQAEKLFQKAFRQEREAALALHHRHDAEPTRSILFRSAATLALDIEDYEAARELAAKGLEGAPPANITAELKRLRRSRASSV